MKSAEEWMEQSNDPKNWLSSNRFDKSFIEQIQRDALLEAFKLVREKHSITGAADAILERSKKI